jgi:hypothetical protein
MTPAGEVIATAKGLGDLRLGGSVAYYQTKRGEIF